MNLSRQPIKALFSIKQSFCGIASELRIHAISGEILDTDPLLNKVKYFIAHCSQEVIKIIFSKRETPKMDFLIFCSQISAIMSVLRKIYLLVIKIGLQYLLTYSVTKNIKKCRKNYKCNIRYRLKLKLNTSLFRISHKQFDHEHEIVKA